MGSKVYVVAGESGEYSDYSMWLVKAFTTHQDAVAYAEAADAYVKAFGTGGFVPFPGLHAHGSREHQANDEWYNARRAAHVAYFTTNPFDDKMTTDAWYSVHEIDVVA